MKLEQNVNVHWQELLNAKTYIYVAQEQWPAYLQRRYTLPESESVKPL